jgi:hypothetical protein
VLSRSGPAVWPGVLATVAIAAAVLSGPLVRPLQPTVGGGPQYRLKAVTLPSGAESPVRWNPCQSAVTYRVNLKGVARAKRPAMLKQVRRAFRQLAEADGITYRYAGTTKYVPQRSTLPQAPADVVVAVVAPDATDLGLTPTALGVGGVLWATWSGEYGEGAVIVRGYVLLNPVEWKTVEPGFGTGKTQGNALLHELGHATGLEHVDAPGQLMNPVLTAAAPAGFGPGDRAGLSKLGVGAGCVARPDSVTTVDNG